LLALLPPKIELPNKSDPCWKISLAVDKLELVKELPKAVLPEIDEPNIEGRLSDFFKPKGSCFISKI
jgi:hypothetical protein